MIPHHRNIHIDEEYWGVLDGFGSRSLDAIDVQLYTFEADA